MEETYLSQTIPKLDWWLNCIKLINPMYNHTDINWYLIFQFKHVSFNDFVRSMVIVCLLIFWYWFHLSMKFDLFTNICKVINSIIYLLVHQEYKTNAIQFEWLELLLFCSSFFSYWIFVLVLKRYHISLESAIQMQSKFATLHSCVYRYSHDDNKQNWRIEQACDVI